MGSTDLAVREYWGYLVKPDKSPTPVFEQLLLGIANYIGRHIAPWDTQCLTPKKLATFYRLVGGDYDALFLETPQASLSFIYQSLGCFHSLQPEGDPFNPPSVPALTSQGFIRWQTVQLLLEPEEHVPFLQEAVKRFEITHPRDGGPFPRILPREALPSKPDLDMIEWHERVSDRLRLEAQASQLRNAPIALSDGEPESSVASSVDDQSIVDAAGYFSDPRPHPSFRRPNFHISPWAIPPQSPSYNSPQDAPWSSERRNTDSHFHRLPRNPSSWSCDGGTPTGLKPHNDRWRRHHPRSPSTSSSSSSSTGSSALSSPVLHPTRPRAFPPLERRHSTSLPYNSPQQSHLSRSQTSYIPPQQPLSPPIPEALRSDVKGTNVRWRDIHDISHLSRNIPGTPDETPPYRYDRNGSSRDRCRSDPDCDSKSSKARMKSPVRGVGGRRYATEGMSWR